MDSFCQGLIQNELDPLLLMIHNESMAFSDWLRSLPGAPTPTIAAKRSNLSGPTLLRHSERGYSTADNVITIARAYGVNPVDALVDNGILQPEEFDDERSTVKNVLKEATVAELLEALVEYVNNSGLVEGRFEMNSLTNHRETTQDHIPSPDDGWQYEEMAAADDSPDEPMPGDDDYHDGP